MKHKHYEKIVAKAANVNLVILAREGDRDDGKWYELQCMPRWGDANYFLCLPQHKDAVLCGLNGGEFQVKCSKDYYSDSWHLNGDKWIGDHVWYMMDNHHSRIKPRKEKRWIAVDSDGYVMPMHCGSKESAQEHAKHTKRLLKPTQIIEIEVEI